MKFQGEDSYHDFWSVDFNTMILTWLSVNNETWALQRISNRHWKYRGFVFAHQAQWKSFDVITAIAIEEQYQTWLKIKDNPVKELMYKIGYKDHSGES